MPLSTAELLAKAFNESPSQTSRIVLNVKQKSDSSTQQDKTSDGGSSWMDLAQELEDSDKNLQTLLKEVSDDPLTHPQSLPSHPQHHPAAPIISYEDRSVLNSKSILHSSINYRLCPYCSRPLWVSALQYHIESSCPKAPPLPKLATGSTAIVELASSSQTNGTKRKKRQSMSSSAAQAGNISPTKRRKIDARDISTTIITSGDEPANESTVANDNTSSTANGTDNDGEALDDPKRKVRKFNMTKQRKLALAAAQAEAIAKGEKPPTIDQLDLAKITKKPGKKPRKTKEKEKEKVTKPKAPVDIEKQCGVPLPNGGLCARSLTCKTHSMSAKRAVRGRSAPYDVLLANYQKMNQVKMASLSTVQQLADENEALGGSEVDPEEEVKQVMEGVQYSNPLPMEQKVIIPTRIKSKFIKMREMLAGALLPRGVRPLGGFLGRSLAINPSNSTDIHYIRPVNQVLKQQKLMQLQAQHQAQARQLAIQQQLAQQQQHLTPQQLAQQQQLMQLAHQQLTRHQLARQQMGQPQLNPQQQQQFLQQQLFVQTQRLQQAQQQAQQAQQAQKQ